MEIIMTTTTPQSNHMHCPPVFTANEYNRRIQLLAGQMEEARLDAFIAFTSSWFRQPAAVTYFTGYETLFGSAIFLYVTSGGGRHLILDNFWDVIGRPEEKEREREEFHLVDNLGERIAQLLPQDARRVGMVNQRLAPARIMDNLKQALPGVEIVNAQQQLDAVRQVKSQEELALLRYIAGICDVAAETFFNTCRVGISERDVAAEVLYRARKAGADTFWTPICVASGPRLFGMYPIPTRREMQPGEIFMMDCGIKAGGYCGDISRAGVLPGGDSSRQVKLVKAVLKIQERLIQAIRPGLRAGELVDMGFQFASDCGYGDAFRRGMGHGIGSDGHEYPDLGLIEGENALLKENMVVTLEPWLSQPDIGGAQIEDMILITPHGGQRLPNSQRMMIPD